MAITEKKCACGCGKKFYGTERAMFYRGKSGKSNACKMRKRRADKKL